MSLYYEAVSFLSPASSKEGSLKSRIFKSGSTLKSSPATVYALISETAKYDTLLKEVIDNAGLLALEPKLTPILSLLLVHDHLLSKKGIAAKASHPLRRAVERHKARLQAELTKSRVRRGCTSIVDLKKLVAEQATKVGAGRLQPRWVRVNRLKSTVQEQMVSTFSSYTQTSALADVVCTSPEEKLVYADQHIPDLLALPPGIDLTKTQAYKNGEFVLQDKASCFPAYLLLGGSASHTVGDILDACAAPGNKTTHLASIICRQSTMTASTRSDFGLKIFACERDPLRSETLRKMVNAAGADNAITVLAKQDFLALDPEDARFTNVTHLLLDPSCSGSGIIGRDDMPVLQLPEDPKLPKVDPISADGQVREKRAPNKRKRQDESESNDNFGHRDLDREEVPREADFTRLERLASLQTKIIEHAFLFPAARRITYSTCSIHGQENEAVVLRALSGYVAKERGWRAMRRDEQPDGLTKWPHRGRDLEDQKDRNLDSSQAAALCGLNEDAKQACIRCYPGDEQGTMGFFVCGFIRDSTKSGAKMVEEERLERRISHEVDEEWGGFSDNETVESIH